MSTDNQDTQKILDLFKYGSMFILLLHFYVTCHPALREWGLTASEIDTLVYNLSRHAPVLEGIMWPKLFALLLIGVSLAGTKGRKDEKLKWQPIVYYIAVGLLLYLVSGLFLLLPVPASFWGGIYLFITTGGYLSIITGGSQVSRLLKLRFNNDIFNDLNESFPQEERLIKNEYSINLPAEYTFRGKTRQSWLNLTQPHRGTICAGSPGAGKSYFFLRHYLTQSIANLSCIFLYDYKFPDLTRIMYNHALLHQHRYPKKPGIYILNFDDLSRTHRCNVLYPEMLTDLTDATEAARILMISLNKSWSGKSGDFFVESPINFVCALFWFLKKYQGGKFCSLPHAIELAGVEYRELFAVLSLEEEISVLINPFISALKNGAAEQLEGQIASAKIGLARLAAPNLYYVLSGSDFTLDINNPDEPKLVAVGSNPAKSSTYGAVISLYVERMHKLINKKNQRHCALIYDEYPTLTASVDLIAVGRSNKIAIAIGIQDFSQLVRDYGKEQAEVIMNICGNIIAGQMMGQGAKDISERIGRINQEKESTTLSATDTSLSRSTQLDVAIPPSRISNLSSGEFVGVFADSPAQPVKLKPFHARIKNDHAAIAREEAAYKELPIIREGTPEELQKEVMDNYYQIKADIRNLISSEIARIERSTDTPTPTTTDAGKQSGSSTTPNKKASSTTSL